MEESFASITVVVLFYGQVKTTLQKVQWFSQSFTDVIKFYKKYFYNDLKSTISGPFIRLTVCAVFISSKWVSVVMLADTVGGLINDDIQHHGWSAGVR